MKSKISDFVRKKPKNVKSVLVQARINSDLRDQVVDKMERDGVVSMKELIVACFQIYLSETGKK